MPKSTNDKMRLSKLIEIRRMRFRAYADTRIYAVQKGKKVDFWRKKSTLKTQKKSGGGVLQSPLFTKIKKYERNFFRKIRQKTR